MQPSPAGSRFTLVFLLLAAFLAGSALDTQLLDRVDVANKAWTYQRTVPTLSPLGSDLQIFTEASKQMYYQQNPLGPNYNSPPLTAAVFFPFVLLSYQMGYRVMLVVNVACNLLSLVLVMVLAFRVFAADPGGSQSPVVPVAIGAGLLVAGVSQFFGYALEFALERGNYDSLALTAMLAGVWLGDRFPRMIWLQVLSLSFAAHLKVYPALLLFLPLWRHGWKALLPVVAINTAMLFYFGIHRGQEFLVGLYQYASHPYIWVGNHSAASFSSLVLEPWMARVLPRPFVHGACLAFLLGTTLALWGLGLRKLFRHGREEGRALWALALSIPLMSALTSVSNDYKLVIMLVPVFLAVTTLARRFLETGRRRYAVVLALVLFGVILMQRSVLAPALIVTANKFPVVLLLEAVVCWLVWTGAASPPESETTA